MKSLESNPEAPRVPLAPTDKLEDAAGALFREHGLDEKKSKSFISDVLKQKGIECAYIMHRLAKADQEAELMGLLEDPSDSQELLSLIDLDTVSDDIKNHYGLPTA